MSRIDPRVTRTKDLVRRAAMEELGVRGWGELTIDGVAERAGVARSTVYRHWPDRQALVLDALNQLSTQPAPVPGGTARERVLQLLTHLAERFADPEHAPLAIALIDAAEREPELRAVHRRFGRERRQALVDALDEAGVASPDLLATALAGAVLYRRVMGEPPLAPEDITALVDGVLGRA